MRKDLHDNFQIRPVLLPWVEGYVTESELELLAAWQDNKLRDEMLEQGIVTLLGKPANQEDDGIMSQRSMWLKLELKLLLY